MPPQVAPPNQATPLSWDAADHLVGGAIMIAVIGEEAHQPLVDDRSGDHLGAWKLADALDEAFRKGAATLHDLGYSSAPERADRRIGRKAASAPRPFGIPILLIAQLSAGHGIARILREGGTMRGRMRDEHEA